MMLSKILSYRFKTNNKNCKLIDLTVYQLIEKNIRIVNT